MESLARKILDLGSESAECRLYCQIQYSPDSRYPIMLRNKNLILLLSAKCLQLPDNFFVMLLEIPLHGWHSCRLCLKLLFWTSPALGFIKIKLPFLDTEVIRYTTAGYHN